MLGSGERGAADAVALLFLAHAWSAVLADFCRELLPTSPVSSSPGKGQEMKPWHMLTWQSSLSHPPKPKYRRANWFSTVPLPLCTSVLGFVGWQRFPRTLWSGVGAAPGRWLRKSTIIQVHPNRKFLSGSDSNQRIAMGFCLKWFLSDLKPGLYIVIPELGLWPVLTHHLQFHCWVSQVYCSLFIFPPYNILLKSHSSQGLWILWMLHISLWLWSYSL